MTIYSLLFCPLTPELMAVFEQGYRWQFSSGTPSWLILPSFLLLKSHQKQVHVGRVTGDHLTHKCMVGGWSLRGRVCVGVLIIWSHHQPCSLELRPELAREA